MDSNGKKLVLAVVVGAPQEPIYDVVGSGRLGELRTIIKDGLVPTLDRLKTVQPGNYGFILDYVQAPRGTPLEEKVKEAKRHHEPAGRYDAVFTIASSATAAAQALFGSSAGNAPIVFVVVSDPKGEGLVQNLQRPEGNTTGFSTNLRDDAEAALSLFLDWAQTINTTVYAMHQPFFPPAHPIIERLKRVAKGHRPNSADFERKFVEKPSEVENCIRNQMSGGNANGLFLIPDDLVLGQAFRGNLFSLANGKRLPTFCQQVELVNRDPTNWQNNALGAFGIPGVETGKASAAYVDKLLRNVPPKNLKVVIPLDPAFPNLVPVSAWNPDVAENLGLPREVKPASVPPKYRKRAGAARRRGVAPKKARAGRKRPARKKAKGK